MIIKTTKLFFLLFFLSIGLFKYKQVLKLFLRVKAFYSKLKLKLTNSITLKILN